MEKYWKTTRKALCLILERKTKIAYFLVDNLWNPAKNGQKQSERAYLESAANTCTCLIPSSISSYFRLHSYLLFHIVFFYENFDSQTLYRWKINGVGT